jgi:DnaJ-class molecular chaperone
MDDYYDLLGVDADAAVTDIRAAYRDRKAEVSGRDDDNAS